LQSANPKEIEKLRAELEIRNAIDAFPGELERYIQLIKFAVASYVCEGIFQGSLQPSVGFQLIQPIWNSAGSLDELTTLFLHAYEHYSRSSWSVFDRQPDTKQVYSPNFEQKFFYYYVFKGMDILAKNGSTNPNYGTIRFPEITARTKETSELILSQWDEKWKPNMGKQKSEAKRLVKILLRFISPPPIAKSTSSRVRRGTPKNP
jgi:hypothetical protein